MIDPVRTLLNAKARRGSDFFTLGKYLLKIVRVAMFEGGEANDTYFVAEFEVMKSELLDADVKPNSKGSRVSFVNNMTRHIACHADVKAFLEVACKAANTKLTPDLLESLRDDDNDVFNGVIISDTTYQKTSKKNGKVLTLHNFSVPSDVDYVQESTSDNYDDALVNSILSK